MVDIQSVAGEIRRWKKEEEEEEDRKKLQGKNIMAPLLHTAAITRQLHFARSVHSRQATCPKNLVKIARVVPEISSRTDRQTHRQTYSSQYLATAKPLSRAK